jgi:hypothetical protein
MKIEVSIGEIVDKLSILQIKKNNIKDPEKLANVTKEYQYLHEIVFANLNIDFNDYQRLVHINDRLWTIEDDIRDKERKGEFDDQFIFIARSVYQKNDERARIKKDINLKYGSDFVEEKSYAKY